MANVIEFDRLVSYFDADLSALEKKYAKAIKLGDQLEAHWKKLKLTPGASSTGGGKTAIDREMAKAKADIRQMERERLSMERSTTRAVEREARLQATARTREFKRSMNQMLADSRQRVREEARLVSRTTSRATGSLGNGLLPLTGGLLGGLTALEVGKFFATSAMGIEDARNKFTALEGSVEKANIRIAKLLQLSRENVGVNFFDALTNYSQLDAIGGIAETSINRIVAALGRLDTAFKIDSQEAFLRNLTQIFTQGFERQDIKEALGRVPIFEQLLEKAFGTKDAAKLKELKASGQLTIDTWIAGIAEAIQTDSRLTGLKETMSTKLLKALTELNVAAAPVGEAILAQLAPELDRAISGLQQRDYTQIGNAIGGAIGRAIGQGMAAGIDEASSGQRSDDVLGGLEEGFERSIAEAFNAESYSAVIGNFFIELNNMIQRGSQSLFSGISSVTVEPVADLILEKMGFGPNTGSAIIGAWFDKQEAALLDHQRAAKFDRLTQSINAQSAIFADPASSEAAKSQAMAALNNLSRALTEEAKKIEAEAAKNGQQIGNALGSGIGDGVAAQQGDIAVVTAATIPSNVAGVDSKGASIGQHFAMGIANGIRSGGGWVGSAVAALIDAAFSRGKTEAEIKSPSERAARELGLPFTEGIAKGLKGPKAKKAIRQSLKDLYDDLVYEAGKINTDAGRSMGIAERMLGIGLGDQAGSFEGQLSKINQFYDKLLEIEKDSFKKRIANIARQEELINQRKDLKPGEKRTMLRSLGDARQGAIDERRNAFGDLDARRSADINEAAMRRIEMAQRSLARTVVESETHMIGVRRSAEAEAQAHYDNELDRAKDLIKRYTDERNKYAEGSAQYIFWNNKMVDAEEDRKDVVVRGSGEIARARQSDQEALKSHLESIRQFSQQTVTAELDAEQARIEMMRDAGADRELIFQAERALAVRQENFRHDQRKAEIEAAAKSLLDIATTEAQRLEIIGSSNAQMEAEVRRHQSVITQITAETGRVSILEQWRKMAAEIPTYQSQFEDFAIGLPNLLGDSFKAGLLNMEEGWDGFWQSAKETFFRSLQEMLAELAKAQLIKGLVGLFGGLLGGAAGAGGGGAATGPSSGLTFADGGVPPMNQVSLVGERGPELFVPKVAGRILSHEDSMAALGGGGRPQQVVVHNHFHANERTGAFSRPSAQQAARDTSEYLQRVNRRG